MSRHVTPTSIKMLSGNYFDYADLENSPILIEDIAHALSHINRFNGHTEEPYSVAQHSVIGSLYADKDQAFKFLMHDAHEAYVGDMVSPLQKMVPEFKAYAKKVQAEVLSRFGLTLEDMKEIAHIDIAMLATEQRDVVKAARDIWPSTVGALAYERMLRPWHPQMAKQQFLLRYRQLRGV